MELEQRAKLLEILAEINAGIQHDQLEQDLANRDEERQKLLGDFAHFCKKAWCWIEDIPLQWNWHHQMLCDYLQSLQAGKLPDGREFRDLIINVPPGSSKSMFTSVLWSAWCLAKDPTERILVVSCSDDLVRDQSTLCVKLVQSEWYQAFFGDVVQIDPNDSRTNYWKTTAGGCRRNLTTRKKVIGFHPTIIAYDDIASVDDADNDNERKRVNEWHDKNMLSRGAGAVMRRRRVNIQQRVHEMDMSGHLMKAKTWFLFRIPMEYEPDRLMPDIGLGRDPRKKKGELLWPDMFPESTVDELRRGLGQKYFGQYQQRPTAAGGAIFQVNNLNIIPKELVPWSRFKRIKRAWDKAASQDAGAYTSGVLMGIIELPEKRQEIYIIDVIRGQWSIDKVEAMIHLWAKIDEGKLGTRKFETVFEEEGGSAGKQAVADTMRTNRGLRVRPVSTGGKTKISRWQGLAAAVFSREVFIVQADWTDDFVSEMRNVPKSEYKDQVDSAAMGYNELRNVKFFDLPDPEEDDDPGKVRFHRCTNPLCDRLSTVQGGYCCPQCERAQFAGISKDQMEEIHDSHCDLQHGEMFRKGDWQPGMEFR